MPCGAVSNPHLFSSGRHGWLPAAQLPAQLAFSEFWECYLGGNPEALCWISSQMSKAPNVFEVIALSKNPLLVS